MINAKKFKELYLNYSPLETGADWYNGYNTGEINTITDYRGSIYCWGWHYLGVSLAYMYRKTGDRQYLDYAIPQIDYIIQRKDTDLGVSESFYNTGVVYPVWSDRKYYGNVPYTSSVHTGLICWSILLVAEIIKEFNFVEYQEKADLYINVCGEALAVHDTNQEWIDFSTTKGTVKGRYTTDTQNPWSNRILPLNQAIGYLLGCALHDKLTNSTRYKGKIEKHLTYFKEDCLYYDGVANFDPSYDSYYWAYDPPNRGKWEDVSHAALTATGTYFLNDVYGYNIISSSDMAKIANITDKIISNLSNPPLVRQTIHDYPSSSYTNGYHSWNNDYYPESPRFSLFGVLKPIVLSKTKSVSNYIYEQVIGGYKDLQSSYLTGIAFNLYASPPVIKAKSLNESKFIYNDNGIFRNCIPVVNLENKIIEIELPMFGRTT